MPLYRPSTYTLSCNHAATAANTASAANFHFGVQSGSSAVTTSSQRAFGFPINGTVFAVVSTEMHGTAGAGTQTGTAKIVLQENNATLYDFGSSIVHNYTSTVNAPTIIRVTGLNIPVSASQTYNILAVVPGYGTTATNTQHHFTLYFR